jgi:hypothetical protein
MYTYQEAEGMTTPSNQSKSTLMSKHLLLVMVFLAALLITEGMVFLAFRNSPELKDVLALTFGTFGAWIGAGAAYFFGRENMVTATQSLLKMSRRTPEEILAATVIRDMKSHAVQTFNIDTPLGEIVKWIEAEVEKFVFAVVDNDGQFLRGLSDEAVYRYLYDRARERPNLPFSQSEAEITRQTLSTLIKHFEKDENPGLRRLVEFAMELGEDMTAAEANQKMQQGDRFTGIILDSRRQPTGYITTNDLRRLMVQSGGTA